MTDARRRTSCKMPAPRGRRRRAEVERGRATSINDLRHDEAPRVGQRRKNFVYNSVEMRRFLIGS